jgi:hypothetical protein
MKALSCVMSHMKERIKLSREVVKNLKKMSRLSYANQWEYAGKIEYKGFKFSDPVYVTSKKRNTVTSEDIGEVWYSDICFHTHPGFGEDTHTMTENTPIFTTLPSCADFEVYIKGFPLMQCNILCDAHGYYVININKSFDTKSLPLPEAVNAYMSTLRSTPFMRLHSFSDDGLEFFHATLKIWKRQINSIVNEDLMNLFGISIQYYGYDDESPIVTITSPSSVLHV